MAADGTGLINMAFRTRVTLVCFVLSCLVLRPVVAQSQTQISPPAVGQSVDDFTLNDHNGDARTLSGLAETGPIALVTFRSAGWCAASKDRLVQLQQKTEAFETAGLTLVGLSYDSEPVLSQFATKQKIGFPLLSDPNSKVLRQLGLVNESHKPDTVRHGVAQPAIVLIDRDRKVIGFVSSDSTMLTAPQKLLDAWNKRKAKQPKQVDRINFISVDGNKFVNEEDKRVMFKGIAIADPHKIVNDGHWNKAHFEAIKGWGANLVRIPVHPQNYRDRGPKAYLELLKQAVRWCEELEMYVIIDWHSIGNLKTGKFERDIYITSMKETLQFWDLISRTFAGNPTVAFYEVFNEPSINNGKFGQCNWQQWKLIVEKIIDVIHENDKRVVSLVGGFDWAYNLQPVGANPIDRENVAYVTHPYPGKCDPPREPHWEKNFGYLADRFPIIASEMGFCLEGQYEHFVDDGSYRDAILKYLDEKQISWCCWIFDPDWSPPLIESYRYEPTESGKFFRRAMQSQ